MWNSVTKLPQLPHEARRLSHSHVDGVTVAWRRVDAIDAKLKFGKWLEITLGHASWSRNSGSNFGPPGIAKFKAFAVKKLRRSKRWK